MQIRLYNSLSRRVDAFEPLEGDEVRMYSCGPTVYSYAHIGNMRSFLFADFLQRSLRTVGGYRVRWIMNITDIDDKTIRDSAIGAPTWLPEMGDQGTDRMDNLLAFTAFYRTAFLKDLQSLGVATSDDIAAMPNATDYILPMQQLIGNIVQNGFAYVQEGSVYFNVGAWHRSDRYGRLLNIDFDNFRAGVRIDADEYERDQVSDFVLWKARKDDEPYWEFEINGQQCPGRPGWHIECSTMERDLLGLPFDIHTGGVDLRFPHHEDEIAQSKAGYGVDPTAFWCHNEFLEVEGAKMSKSAKNFYTLRDLLERGHDPLDIRFLMLSGHYRSVLNFTFAGLKSIGKARQRVQEYIYKLHESPDNGSEARGEVDIQALENAVFGELATDLNAPKALGHLFPFLNEYPAAGLKEHCKQELIGFFRKLNAIFAVWDIAERPVETIEIPAEVRQWAGQRLEARKRKDFAAADALRNKIQAAGFTVKDAADGYQIARLVEQ